MADKTEILHRKLGTTFSDQVKRDKAFGILTSYGRECHEKEPARVRLAILKLSEGKLDKLEYYTGIARQDYRDVLAWAEYPRQTKRWSLKDGPEKERIIKADRDDYEAWLAE